MTIQRPHYTVPSQSDLPLNDEPPHEWWNDIPGDVKPHLPHVKNWRHYNPDAQVMAYEFMLRDVLGVDALEGQVGGYEDIDANFRTIRGFAGMAQALHDASARGDQDPVRMRVVSDEPDARHIETFLPPDVLALFERYREEGWTGVSGSPQYGGGGLPLGFANAIMEMGMVNPGVAVLTFLTEGVATAIEAKGSEALKKIWLPLLKIGKASGAMVMTEPLAGSSLADMETTVEMNPDGTTGRVYGYKRFLSSADHNATEGPNGERNIMHMVLARTASPNGYLLRKRGDDDFVEVKETDKDGYLIGPNGEYLLHDNGRKVKESEWRPVLTLVAVPRVPMNEKGQYVDHDGEPTDKPVDNHVRITKLNHKSGLQVQSNTNAEYVGSHGTVVGKVGEGMSNMGIIMRGARIGVGLQSVSAAELMRQNVEAYAQAREQGVAGAIINYANVQEKVLNLRAHSQAGRIIAAEVAIALDIAERGKRDFFNEAERAEHKRYVDVMTPLVKWGLSEKCYAAVDGGVQAMGGEGYMRESVGQVWTDTRIAKIYEGANDVLAMAEGVFQLKHMHAFIRRARADIRDLGGRGPMRDVVEILRHELGTFEEATRWLQTAGLRAKAGDAVAQEKFQAAVNHYMELMYGVASGVALARQAQVATAKMNEPGVGYEERLHYQGMIDTARYYAHNVLDTERDMHLNKMKHNWQHLEIADMGIAKNAQALFNRGASAVTGVVLHARELYHQVADRFSGGRVM